MKAYTINGMVSTTGIVLDEVRAVPKYGIIKIGNSRNGYEIRVPVYANSKILHHVVLSNNKIETVIKEEINPVEDSTQVLLVIKGNNFLQEHFSHTGDRESVYCLNCKISHDLRKDTCTSCGKGLRCIFKALPISIIACAPTSSFCFDFVATLSKDTVLRVGSSNSNDNFARYFMFDGQNLLSATWGQRVDAQLF